MNMWRWVLILWQSFIQAYFSSEAAKNAEFSLQQGIWTLKCIIHCIMWRLSVSTAQCRVCAQSVKRITSTLLYRQDQLCTALYRRRVVPFLTAWGHLLLPLLLSLCICLCLALSSEVIGSLVAVCLCVGSVSYLKCFIVLVCIVFSWQTAAWSLKTLNSTQYFEGCFSFICHSVSSDAAWCYRYWQAGYL